jgi:hypothetical protein
MVLDGGWILILDLWIWQPMAIPHVGKKYERNKNLFIFLVLDYLWKSVNPRSYTKKLFFQW